MKKIGFIGFGNMAEAIIKGLISSGNFEKSEIGVYDTDEIKLKKGASSLGITAFENNEKLIESCECVVLAVKPIALQRMIEPAKEIFCKVNPLVISIAAGQSIDKLISLLGYDASIVRVMPNINATALKAVSGFCASENVTENQKKFAVKVLDSFGESIEIEEDDFSAYSAIAGCSPAYVYLFTDALARVGVKYGLTKKESLEIVSSTVIETARKNIKSDGEALNEIVLNALGAAYKKDKGMGK